jgi:hypothetical protein
MEEGQEKHDGFEKAVREEIFSKSVRAGKRTYFFDVKATRKNDYYLTVTESKKRFNREGRFFYEKHKIFLYKEDFDKFVEGLHEAVEYIKINNPGPTLTIDGEEEEGVGVREESLHANFTDVDFDDLETKK